MSGWRMGNLKGRQKERIQHEIEAISRQQQFSI
jgi:hypothetical protein